MRLPRCLLLATFGWAWSVPSTALVIEVVAASGLPAPEAGPGVSFSTIGEAVLNDVGGVAFKARLEGAVSPTDDQGIWTRDAGADPGLVVRQGDPAAGLPGLTYGEISGGGFTYNDRGEVLFDSFLAGPGLDTTNNQAIFGPDGAGGLTVLAREGDQALGAAPGTVYVGTPTELRLNDVGGVAFTFDIAFEQAGVWATDSTGALALRVQTGDALPGMTAPGGFTLSGLNDAGQLAIHGPAINPGTFGDEGLWRSDPAGGFELLARRGDPAPGSPPSSITDLEHRAVINEAGQVGIIAGLSGSGAREAALGPDGAGGLTVVAEEGASAPGTPAGVVYGPNFQGIHIDERGGLAFGATLSGTGVDASNDFGIWRQDAGGALELVARQGDPVPGLLGISFLSFDPLGLGFDFFRGDGNALGDLLFSAEVTGDGIDASNDEAFFLLLENGTLLLLAREGDHFEVAPGDVRTLASLSFVGAMLNDRREVAVSAAFVAGGNGLLMISVPEATPFGLVALGALALAGLRARCR